jgi:threonine dehydrogenase-like Zn-dependent dehydrogenase
MQEMSEYFPKLSEISAILRKMPEAFSSRQICGHQMIQIFGAGRTGMAIAQGIVSFHLDNVTLTDIDEERLSSEVHDLNIFGVLSNPQDY